MRNKSTQEEKSALPPGKVKPPTLDSLPTQHDSDESVETPLNPETEESQPAENKIIAPDGSPEAKQDQTLHLLS